jgi:hypothetical protein
MPARPKSRRWGLLLLRIAVGAAVSFAVLSLLYGVNQAGLMVLIAVVCTAGLGLIPLLFLSRVVGWIVLAAWAALSKPQDAAAAS